MSRLRHASLLAVLLAAPFVLASDPPPIETLAPSVKPPEASKQEAIELPDFPVVRPPVGATVKLNGNVVYDIKCRVECMVKTFPEGLVTVAREVVPEGETLRVTDNFFDGVKQRRYKGPMTVYMVRAAGKGQVAVLVVPFGFKKESEIKLVVMDVDPGVVPVPPGPNPPDPKPPEPKPPAPPPDGRLGLTKASYDGATAVVDSADKVKAGKKALAGSYRSLASAVAAGGYPDPSTSALNTKKVLDASLASNVEALTGAGVEIGKWDVWGTKVQTQLFAKYKDGSIKTKADWVDAFNEIAAGLEG